MVKIDELNEFFDIDKTEAYAELNIWSENLTIERISELLGLEVSYYFKKGEFPRAKHKESHVSVTSSQEWKRWSFKTEAKPTCDISDQLNELISVFDGKTEYLNTIKKEHNCDINICIVLCNRQKILPGMHLSEEQISFLASIGIGIDFDIYT